MLPPPKVSLPFSFSLQKGLGIRIMGFGIGVQVVGCAVSRFRVHGYNQPSERDQIVSFNCLDLCRKSPDSSERQYRSRT